jgi:hypothetical protein
MACSVKCQFRLRCMAAAGMGGAGCVLQCVVMVHVHQSTCYYFVLFCFVHTSGHVCMHIQCVLRVGDAYRPCIRVQCQLTAAGMGGGTDATCVLAMHMCLLVPIE